MMRRTWSWVSTALLISALATSVHGQGAEFRYYYDPTGRAIAVTASDQQFKSYRYDPADNRTLFTLQPANMPATRQALNDNQVLLRGQKLNSAGGVHSLDFQIDGNVVLYTNGVAGWSTGSALTNAAYFVMQNDGNLVLYNAQMVALWASGSSGGAGSQFIVQTDGNLVVYTNGVAKWSRYGGLV